MGWGEEHTPTGKRSGRRPVEPPEPAEPAMDLLVSTVDGVPMTHRQHVVYAVVQTVALVAVAALLATAYLLGRATVHPDPQVYVVHDSELSTTTTGAP